MNHLNKQKKRQVFKSFTAEFTAAFKIICTGFCIPVENQILENVLCLVLLNLLGLQLYRLYSSSSDHLNDLTFSYCCSFSS